MFGVNKKKILFVTLARIDDINVSGIYTDLLKKFHIEGHEICIVCPNERREKRKTELNMNCNSQILKIKRN